jgi:hypothetical protein
MVFCSFDTFRRQLEKAHAGTRAIGNPAAMIVTNTFITEPGASNVGNNIDAA